MKISDYYVDNVQPKIECLAPDWVEFAFKTELAWDQPKYEMRLPIKLPGIDPFTQNFTFEENPLRNRTWKKMYTVYLNGDRFGVLKIFPTSTMAMAENEMHLKLDNAVCYTDFRNPVLWFTELTGSIFSHVARMDIAGDGKNILHPLNLWLQSKIHKVSRGGEQHTFCKAKINHYAEIDTSYHRLGSPQSEKFMRVYKKSKELSNSGKMYIRNFWKINGMQDTDNVDRIELTLRAKFLRNIFEKDYICNPPGLTNSEYLGNVLNYMVDNSFLASVLDKYCTGMYEFKLMNDTQKYRCKKSYNLHFATLLNVAVKKLTSVQKTISTGIYTTRLALKSMFQKAVSTKNKKWYKLAYEYARNAHLVPYLKDRQNTWITEIKRFARKKLPYLDFYTGLQHGKEIAIEPIELFRKKGAAGYITDLKDHLELLHVNLS